MENVKIYLAGAMGGLTFEEQLGWRKQIEEVMKYGDYSYYKKPMFFSPPEYYTQVDCEPELKAQLEREAMIFDLDKVRKSDLIVANLEKNSIGTYMEMAVAFENRIPIIGLNRKWDVEIHPWLKESCIRIFTSLSDLVEYICDFYLN